MQMQEVWRDIKGYENLYQISNFGNVKSIRRNMVMKQSKNVWGYPTVSLYKDKNEKRYAIHRLVGLNFIENPLNKPEINHIDGNKENNRVENLEWCTRSENMKHSFANGLEKPVYMYGEDNVRSKAMKQYTLDGKYVQTFESGGIASRYLKDKLNLKSDIESIRSSLLRCCRHDKRFKAYGYVWRFENEEF